MTRGRILFATLLVSAAVCGVTAVAQIGGEAAPPSRILDPTPGPNRPTPPVGGTTDTIRSPRFKVELVTITAVDETGWDWPGSDEIFAVYDNQQNRMFTSTYEDVDSGKVIQVPAFENCVWPVMEIVGGWTCLAGGGAAPVLFAVSLFEVDDWRGLIFLGGDGGFCNYNQNEVMRAGAAIPCIENSHLLFSTQIYSYSEAELLQKLPAPFAVFLVDGGHVHHAPPWGWGSGFEYHIKIRITRVADHIEQRPREVER